MKNDVRVEISARHLHLSQEDQDALFGEGYGMKIVKELSQKGQWAAEEKVTVRGPSGELQCRVLGPCRPRTQIELAASDARKIGVDAPLRLSGDLDGSAGCTLVGPKGEIALQEGVIRAKRHLHISDAEAEEFGVKSGDVISVRVPGEAPATFHEIEVRVKPDFRANIHIDTDEANAVMLKEQGKAGTIVR